MTEATDRNDALERIGLRGALRQREGRRERLRLALSVQGAGVGADLEAHEVEAVKSELALIDRQIRELTARLAGSTPESTAEAPSAAEDGAAGGGEGLKPTAPPERPLRAI